MAPACRKAQACRKDQGDQMARARMALAVHRVLAVGHTARKARACRKGQELHMVRERLDSHKAQGHRRMAQTLDHTRQEVHVVPVGREVQMPAAIALAEVVPDVAVPSVAGTAAVAEAAAEAASGKPRLGALSMWTPGLPRCSSRHPGDIHKPAMADTCL